MQDQEQRARDAYETEFGGHPRCVASAPGRINLIGDHTDYNGGFVLPLAIECRTACAVGEGPGRLYSADLEESQNLSGCSADSWAAYPRGVAWAFSEAGHLLPPFQAAFAGDVPIGAGLSSSAALEAATALALNSAFEVDMSRVQLARLCQQAENRFVGVNSGIMDQFTSLMAQAGHALLLDCQSLQFRHVPLDLKGNGLVLMVCDTHVQHRLGNSGYNDRRAVCERAARSLGLSRLRDASPGDLSRLQGDELKRARHVVTENERVLRAAEALESGDFGAFGELMFASHRSLRDDYQVSTPELDAFVEVAHDFGALGARVTGAGFGGSGIALVPGERAGSLQHAVTTRFLEQGYQAPGFATYQPSPGARVTQA